MRVRDEVMEIVDCMWRVESGDGCADAKRRVDFGDGTYLIPQF